MCKSHHTNGVQGPPGKPIVIADFAVAAHLEPVGTGYLQVENLMGDYADLEHTTLFMRVELLVVLTVRDDRPHCLLSYDLAPFVAATLLRWHRSILYKQKF